MLAALLAAVAALAPPAAAQAPPAPTVRFGPVQELAAKSERVSRSEPAGAVDAAGRALLAWSESEGRRSRVLVAAAPADGPFGAPRIVADGEDPQLGVAPDGLAVIAFTDGNGGRIVVGDTGGRFGAPAALHGRRTPSALAMAGDGTAAVVSSGSSRGSTVQLIAPGGGRGAVRRFSANPGGSFLVGDDGESYFGPGELAAGPDGTIAVVTRRGLLERRPGEAAFAHEHRPFARRFADPQVAVGAGGRIGVVAIDRPRCIFEYGCVGRIALAERPAGATAFAAPTPAPVRRYPKDGGARVPAGHAPQIGYGAEGGPVVTWLEDEQVCTACDLDGPFGPRIAWRPGVPRTVLAGDPSGAALTAVGDGVAIAAHEFEDEGSPSDGELARDLWFTSDGRPVRVASAGAFPWDSGDLLAGGPTRLLVAAGGYDDPIRAALATVSR